MASTGNGVPPGQNMAVPPVPNQNPAKNTFSRIQGAVSSPNGAHGMSPSQPHYQGPPNSVPRAPLPPPLHAVPSHTLPSHPQQVNISNSNPSPVQRAGSLPVGSVSTPGSAAGSTPRDWKPDSRYQGLQAQVDSADPAVLRQVLRDNWDKCFVGSEYHTSFVVSPPACIF